MDRTIVVNVTRVGALRDGTFGGSGGGSGSRLEEGGTGIDCVKRCCWITLTHRWKHAAWIILGKGRIIRCSYYSMEVKLCVSEWNQDPDKITENSIHACY